MRRVSGLSKSEREMIVVATSAENQCLYCVVAHGAILRIYEKSSVISEEIAINYRKANISERHKGNAGFCGQNLQQLICNHE